jgi:hypothetical protein
MCLLEAGGATAAAAAADVDAASETPKKSFLFFEKCNKHSLLKYI